MAQERIDAVPPAVFKDEVFVFTTKRDRPRVPFGALVENGLLKPGQTLYFGKTGKVTATVLANGSIIYDGITGSIHQVGREIQNAPCNGWEHWYYLDQNTGERLTIDTLRERYLAETGQLAKISSLTM